MSGLQVGRHSVLDFRCGERFLEIINRSQLHRFQVARNIMVTANYDDGAVAVSRHRMLQNRAALKHGPALAGDDAVEICRFKKACGFLKIRARPNLKSAVVQHAAIAVKVPPVFVDQKDAGSVE